MAGVEGVKFDHKYLGQVIYDGRLDGRRYSLMTPSADEHNVHVHANFRFFDGDRQRKDISSSFLEWMRPCRNARRQKYFAEGILLKSLEKSSSFPYVSMTFWDVTSLHERGIHEPAIQIVESSPRALIQGLPERPGCTSSRYGFYEEEQSIGRDGTTIMPKRPTSAGTIYYILAFKTDGDAHRLATSWRSWTGAEFILWKCPEELSLKRVSFYRHLLPKTDDVMFILLCECSSGLTNQQAAMHFLARLRDRRCGHVGVYQIDQTY